MDQNDGGSLHRRSLDGKAARTQSDGWTRETHSPRDYDLLGLPPTPQEVDSFVKNASPDAYSKLIDQLLASERYGERWWRHWLDTVRYAESGGYEFDGDCSGAYHYRDFVIKSFNQDMPYDEFVRLQLAGDHLKPGDFSAASCHRLPGRGSISGADDRQNPRADSLRSSRRYGFHDGNVDAGPLAGMRRCHAHKYDPILQEDYYHLVAVMGRTDSTQAKLDPNPEIYRKAKAEYDLAHAPFITARECFEKEQLPTRVRSWYEKNKAKPAPNWLILDALEGKGKAPMKKLPDGSLLAEGKAEKGDTYTITAQTWQKEVKAIRLEALADTSLPKKGPGRGPDGNFLLTEISLSAVPLDQPKAKPVVVKLKPVKATFAQDKFPLAGTIDTNKATGWSIAPQFGNTHAALFELEGFKGFETGTLLTVTLKFEGEAFGIGRTRISITPGKPSDNLLLAGVLQAEEELKTLLTASKSEVNDKNRAADRALVSNARSRSRTHLFRCGKSCKKGASTCFDPGLSLRNPVEVAMSIFSSAVKPSGKTA